MLNITKIALESSNIKKVFLSYDGFNLSTLYNRHQHYILSVLDWTLQNIGRGCFHFFLFANL